MKPMRNNYHPLITLLSLIFLILMMIGAILSAYDCHISGGVLVRSAAGNYACVQPLNPK